MSTRRDRPISQRLASELGTLFYYHPPKTLRQNLRKMFMDYVLRELQVGASDYCEELILGLNWLFHFLDEAEEELDNKEEMYKQPIAGAAASLAASSDSLQGVINFIVAMVQPERVFCMKYDDPLVTEHRDYYELLVVIPDASQKPFRHYEALIDLSCLGTDKVICSLIQSATLNQYLSESNLFYSSTCTEQNVVYEDSTTRLAKPDGEKLAAAKEEARKVFTSSYDKARLFMDGAKAYLEKEALDLSAFMLQQATELTLRGIILAYTGRDVKTHSITELLKNCRRVAPQLYVILQGTTPDKQRLLEVLESAYLNSRYQKGFEVDDDDVQALIGMVEVLLGSAWEGMMKE